MLKNRTNAAVLAATGAALLLWFVAGWLGTTTHGVGWQLYFPGVPGSWQYARTLGVAPLVAGFVVLAVVVLGLAVPVLRSRGTGAVTVVLGLWFASVAGGALAALTWSLVIDDALFQSPLPGAVQHQFLAQGAHWGLAVGWIVGLVGAGVRGDRPRDTASQHTTPQRAALLGAATAAALGVVGWAATSFLAGWANTQIQRGSGELRDDALGFVLFVLPVSRGISLSTIDDADVVSILGGAAALAVVVLVIGWVAGRHATITGGRTAYVLALWFATVAGSTVAAAVSLLPYASQVGGMGQLWRYGASVVVGGGLWGLQYGWIAALGGLLVAWLVGRASVPAGPVPADSVPLDSVPVDSVPDGPGAAPEPPQSAAPASPPA